MEAVGSKDPMCPGSEAPVLIAPPSRPPPPPPTRRPPPLPTTTAEIAETTPPAELKSKRSKRNKQQKQSKQPKQPKQPKQAKQAKKQLLVDEIGEALVAQLYSRPKTSASCPCCDSNPSVADQLHSVLTPSTTSGGSDNSPKTSSSRSRSNSSHSSRTLLESNTSLAYKFLGAHNTSLSTPHLSLDSLKPRLERPVRGLSRTHLEKHPSVFSLNDIANRDAVERLAAEYGRVSHMGILDPSYTFFVNKARTAALSFKVRNKVAIVGGDPLCDPSLFPSVLAEFEEYRKRFHWGIVFMGASSTLVNYARERKWMTMQFGTERVLNSLTNEVLLEKCGKRIIVQNRQLLNPSKGAITLGLYVPSVEEDLALQDQLFAIYDSWRLERNRTSSTQAFITVYDPFSLPGLMTYIYTRGPDGNPNGFAALRKIGANQGYHIDPCIAAPGAPKGISDLLVFAAMSLLNRAGVSYLSLGFEPLDELGEITGMPPLLDKLTRAIYLHAYPRLPIGGKKAYHNKFRPDEQQESGLFLVFPSGVYNPREMVATIHMANISIRKLIFSDPKSSAKNVSGNQKQQSDEKPSENS